MSKILEGNIIKKANTKHPYNKQQLEELKKCSSVNDNGHIYFMEHFGYLKHPSKGRMLFKPFEYQKRLIENYHNHRFSISMLGRQMGKAISGDTPIVTPNGLVCMKELKVGDTVYDSNGEQTKVIFKTDTQQNRKCYKVKFIHGEEIIADAEHEWVVINDNGEGQIYTTEQLIQYNQSVTNVRNGITIKLAPAIKFDKKDVPIDPYELGVWLGTGHSESNVIATRADDYEEFSKILKVECVKSRKNSTSCFGIKLADLSTAILKESNLYGDKHIPTEYIFNDIDTRLEILRGLMDTNGSVEKNGLCYFYHSDLDMIKGVRLLLSSLGIKSTLTSKDTTRKMNFELCFTTCDFDVFKLPRKLQRQHNSKQDINYKRFGIDDIEEVSSEPVYCIEVDSETHMFLAGETLIPTHNCTLGETVIIVRNKRTGEVLEVEIADFFSRFESVSYKYYT